jgi:hypothetical protein
MKTCKECKIEFLPTGKNQTWCKPCGETRSKEMTRAGWRRGQRKKKYGISSEQYNEMFIKQDGYCAICGGHQTLFDTSLAVDHCHSSNIIRGLLCRNCNLMLGFAKDNLETLKKAINYLKK